MKTGLKNYLEGVLGASALLLDWRVAVAEPSVLSSSLSADRGRSDVEAERTSFNVNKSKYVPSLLDLQKLTVGHALLLHGEISLLLLLEGLLELDVFLISIGQLRLQVADLFFGERVLRRKVGFEGHICGFEPCKLEFDVSF